MSKKWGKQWHTFIIQMIQIQIQVHTVSINHSRESLSPCLISVSIAHTYTQNDTHKRHFFTYTCFSEFKDFLSRIAGSRTFFSYFFMILAQNDEQLAFLDILDTHTHTHTHTHTNTHTLLHPAELLSESYSDVVLCVISAAWRQCWTLLLWYAKKTL